MENILSLLGLTPRHKVVLETANSDGSQTLALPNGEFITLWAAERRATALRSASELIEVQGRVWVEPIS